MINTIKTVVVKRVNSKCSHHKEEKYFLFLLILFLHEKMNIHQTYCSNHFMMHVRQIIMLYSLDLHSVSYQLYLKTEKKI